MSHENIDRREFLNRSAKGIAGLTAASFLRNGLFTGPYIKNTNVADKVFVLGIDGMDPVLLRRFIARGGMPTFKKFVESNYFAPLQTTMPPQSPVAWSSFITGTNPGGHGIFDFIGRDPSTLIPFLSTSRSSEAQKTIRVGKWLIPLDGGKVELLRRGVAFWTVLEEKNIFTSLFKLPANFPVYSSRTRTLSGMGTPDLLGTAGTFTYFTDVEVPDADTFTGGRVARVIPADHTIRSKLEGPVNSYRSDGKNIEVNFTVHRDPWEPVVKIEIQGHEIILQQGEWSEWIPLKFELMPMIASVHGTVRIYMQEVHPNFRMYVSPINVDSKHADLPISSPERYSRDLSEAIGRFYTQGFPEDTKALSYGVFSDDEFLKQSKFVLKERLKAFDYELSRFHEGLFFFYFSSIDQNSHMLLRNMDPAHPLYDPKASPEVKEAIYDYYCSMDDVLKATLSKMNNNSTLIILSDHGFAPFTREFNLSTWLVENGFSAMTDPTKMEENEYFDFVDWSKTKAYVLGLNAIYINLFGREANGIVFPQDVTRIKEEIAAKLEKVRDPKNGRKIIARVYDSRHIYSGPCLDTAPDLLVGYESGYRISEGAAFGRFPGEIVCDRKDKWSADHCMDPQIVPGVLLTNRDVSLEKPGIWDLAPSILHAFGLEVPREMDGNPIFF